MGVVIIIRSIALMQAKNKKPMMVVKTVMRQAFDDAGIKPQINHKSGLKYVPQWTATAREKRKGR